MYQQEKPRRKFLIDNLTYQDNQQIASDCQDLLFVNSGTVPLTINAGLKLFAGQYIAFNANVGEMDKTKYNCVFDNSAGKKQLTVFRKKYQDGLQ
jgi:hypothetical protein